MGNLKDWMEITDKQLEALSEMGEHLSDVQDKQNKEIKLLVELVDLLNKRLELFETLIKIKEV